VFIRVHQVALIFSYLFMPPRCEFSEIFFVAPQHSRAVQRNLI